jgi:diguanylate cyclase (GGDEF)-like protein
MWMGGDRGLYRVDALGLRPAHAQPTPAIRRIVDGNEHLIAQPHPSLPYNFGRVRIEISPLSYNTKTEYQYRLDPVDADWGPWTEQAFLDYTNLAANDYTFRVRTRGSAGSVSKEARWTFTVLAPWYATGGAARLWMLLAALVIAAIVFLRTSALHRRARTLQGPVDEQTIMLRQANERLERLSLSDDLTGVANRRAFDRALNEMWKRAARHDLPLSIVMLDLDHFKALNDTQGHAAGDEYLRRVARLLQQAIRDDGDDLVARWGGEEFVILLGNTDESAALAVAERMRTAVASLGITASLGVAARAHEGDPETLIRRADLALYAAKRAGRNCVRGAERKSA